MRYDPTQTLITDYYEIIKQAEKFARSSPELANVFSFSKDHLLSQSLDNASDNAKKRDFTTFFRQIVDNAKKNVGKLPQSKRHSEVIKKFSTSLFLYSGWPYGL